VIEASAQCRLADEYDAAQERGEVAKQGGARNFKVPNENFETTTADIGLTRKQVHEARAAARFLQLNAACWWGGTPRRRKGGGVIVTQRGSLCTFTTFTSIVLLTIFTS
jgi:hypothetical protein